MRDVKQKTAWLTVVIIGRNEELRLPDLFASLPEEIISNIIYVDSGSTDSSVNIALANGARVFRVERGSVYGPGTGRYVGTVEARGDWVLYLDGDMVLKEEFVCFIKKLMVNLPGIKEDIAGFIGRTRNLYLDDYNTVRAVRDYVVLPANMMGSIQELGRPVDYHGGAVLYRRSAVVNAGNWNPAVLQLEEIDLYCRVKALGSHIRAVDVPMADHYTPYLSIRSKLSMNFFPRWGEKKFWGAGQVVAYHWKRGTLFRFIKCYPYPFVVLAGLLTLPLFFTGYYLLPLGLNLAIAVVIGLKTKWYYYLVYLGNLFQMIRGLGKYRYFIPFYREIKD